MSGGHHSAFLRRPYGEWRRWCPAVRDTCRGLLQGASWALERAL